MSIRCSERVLHDVPGWEFNRSRSIGQMIRDARDHGVMPDMDTVQAAFDDDGEVSVDVFANPRTDPMDLLNEGLIKERSAMVSAVSKTDKGTDTVAKSDANGAAKTGADAE